MHRVRLASLHAEVGVRSDRTFQSKNRNNTIPQKESASTHRGYVILGSFHTCLILALLMVVRRDPPARNEFLARRSLACAFYQKIRIIEPMSRWERALCLHQLHAQGGEPRRKEQDWRDGEKDPTGTTKHTRELCGDLVLASPD
jgi:hypothetical protein